MYGKDVVLDVAFRIQSECAVCFIDILLFRAGIEQNPGPNGTLTMNDPGFKNWLKAAYGFRYLKSGLEDFVSNQIGQRHGMLKQKVAQQYQNVQSCTSCTFNNLLPDHTGNHCNQRLRRNCYCRQDPHTRRKCPVNFCSYFYHLIVDDHMKNSPLWSSTDPTKWFMDCFQYAKCFLSTHSPANTMKELDCTGILSIVVHNDYIQQSVHDVNLFKKCRDNRNKIFHSGNYHVADHEMADHIDDMIQVLEDRKYLITDLRANQMVTQLNKLKAGQVFITEVDIVGLVQDSVAAINELGGEVKQEISSQRQQFLNNFKEEYDNAVIDIKKKEGEAINRIVQQKDNAVHQISEQKDNTVHQISEQKDNAVHQISEQKDNAVHQISEQKDNAVHQISEQKDNAVHQISEQKDNAVHQISEQKDNAVHQISEQKDNAVHQFSEHRDEAICKLQQATTNLETSCETVKQDLINIYQRDCSMVQVSPLLDCESDHLLGVYQYPSMLHVDYFKDQTDKNNLPVNSFEDIFGSEDRLYRNIYITGDAGVGKTTFCKYMCMLWCQAVTGSSIEGGLSERAEKDVAFMSKFDYVFFVSLRDTDRTDVIAMIVDQLFFAQSDAKWEKMYSCIENIIRQNKCLLIMDAFDEWYPKPLSNKENVLPSKIPSEKCVYLTTCRPYKIETRRLSRTDIDHQVQVNGLDEQSSTAYIKKLVNYLNHENSCNKSSDDFQREIERFELGDQLHIPMIASHLVVLWFNHRVSNMSRALIYGYVVDMLFERARKRKLDFPPVRGTVVQLPDVFTKLKHLNENVSFLRQICLLSFRSLFKQDDNITSLVFTSDQLISEPYSLSEEDINFLCKIGLLSKNKISGCFLPQKQKLSFLHESYMEFLAALYVVAFDTDISIDNAVKQCTTIDDFVKLDNFMVLLAGFSVHNIDNFLESICQTLSDNLELCRRKFSIHGDISSGVKLVSFNSIVVKIKHIVFLLKLFC